jgi:hypothetical protein
MSRPHRLTGYVLFYICSLQDQPERNHLFPVAELQRLAVPVPPIMNKIMQKKEGRYRNVLHFSMPSPDCCPEVLALKFSPQLIQPF